MKKFTLTTLAIILSCGFAYATLQYGSTYSYSLEQDGTDSASGNTASGTAPLYTVASGKIGAGGNFDPATTTFLGTSNFTGSNDWTTCFWYNPRTLAPAGQGLVNKDDVGTKRVFSFLLSTNSITLYAWGTAQAFHQTTTAASGMSVGTWYQWCGVWDSANNLVTLYKNAVSFATIALTGNQAADTVSNRISIGAQDGGPSNYASGFIDEVQYWNRALSQTEITQNYNKGLGLQWPFDFNLNMWGDF